MLKDRKDMNSSEFVRMQDKIEHFLTKKNATNIENIEIFNVFFRPL